MIQVGFSEQAGVDAVGVSANPLFGAPPQEVRLADPPLVRVLCQVQFPTILAVRKAESVIGFQEMIRGGYPILREEKVRNVTLRPPSELETEDDVIWRFSDQTQQWRVSLSSSFVAFETTKYESRHGFLDRLTEILGAVEEKLNPQISTRMGLRYVNRIAGPPFDQIDTMVRKEVLALIATPLASSIERMLSEARLEAEEASLWVRWGKLPGKLAPAGLPLDAVETDSWIIDIDMYDESRGQEFRAARLTELGRIFAERIYSVFRWMVTDELLRWYGGNP